MGGTVTALPARQTAKRDADYPLAVTLNGIQDTDESATAITVIANTTGVFGGADGSNASFPLTNLWNRERTEPWKYGSSVATTYICLDAGAGRTIQGDCMILEGFALDFASTTLSIRARCSDTLDGSNVVDSPDTPFEISKAPAGDETHIAVDFADSNYAARYWEIRLVAGGATVHQATQLWIGQQRQMDWNADAPHDYRRQVSDWENADSPVGFSLRTSRHYIRERRAGTWWAFSIESQAHLRSMESETKGWARPYWWFDSPNDAKSGSTSALFVQNRSRQLVMPSETKYDYAADLIWEADMVEQAPRAEDV